MMPYWNSMFRSYSGKLPVLLFLRSQSLTLATITTDAGFTTMECLPHAKHISRCLEYACEQAGGKSQPHGTYTSMGRGGANKMKQ